MSRWKEKKVDEDAALGIFGEDFDHARPMWNAEVYFILRNYLDDRANSDANTNNILSSSSSSATLPAAQTQIIQDTLTYVSSLNTYPSPDAVNTAHELHAHYPALSEWELAVINNTRIDDIEECLSLIPTLRAKVERGDIEREKVEELLNQLKRFQIQ